MGNPWGAEAQEGIQDVGQNKFGRFYDAVSI